MTNIPRILPIGSRILLAGALGCTRRTLPAADTVADRGAAEEVAARVLVQRVVSVDPDVVQDGSPTKRRLLAQIRPDRERSRRVCEAYRRRVLPRWRGSQSRVVALFAGR